MKKAADKDSISAYELLFNAIVEVKSVKLGYRRAEKWAHKRLKELGVQRQASGKVGGDAQ